MKYVNIIWDANNIEMMLNDSSFIKKSPISNFLLCLVLKSYFSTFAIYIMLLIYLGSLDSKIHCLMYFSSCFHL